MKLEKGKPYLCIVFALFTTKQASVPRVVKQRLFIIISLYSRGYKQIESSKNFLTLTGYKHFIVILSLSVLPCNLIAQEVTVLDTLKVKTIEGTGNGEVVTNQDHSSLFPKTLSIDEARPAMNASELLLPKINSISPQLPFGMQGISSRRNYIGLGATNSATLFKSFNYGNLSAIAYATVQKQFYDYRNVTMLSVGASFNYTIDNNWSVTAFGQYVSPYTPFRPVVQAMMPTSGYGGYVTYQTDFFSISGGVRQEYNPYTMSWETNPIIMPQVKIGDVKIGVDIGPAVKNGIVNMQRDKNSGPPPPQNSKGR